MSTQPFNDSFIIGDDEETAALGTPVYADVRGSGARAPTLRMSDADLEHLSDPYEGSLAETMYTYTSTPFAGQGDVDFKITNSVFDMDADENTDQIGVVYKPFPAQSARGFSIDELVSLDGAGVDTTTEPSTPTLGGRLQSPHGKPGFDSADQASRIYARVSSPARARRADTDHTKFDGADKSEVKDMEQQARMRTSSTRRELNMGEVVPSPQLNMGEVVQSPRDIVANRRRRLELRRKREEADRGQIVSKRGGRKNNGN
jgi:hypothetical protein